MCLNFKFDRFSVLIVVRCVRMSVRFVRLFFFRFVLLFASFCCCFFFVCVCFFLRVCASAAAIFLGVCMFAPFCFVCVSVPPCCFVSVLAPPSLCVLSLFQRAAVSALDEVCLFAFFPVCVVVCVSSSCLCMSASFFMCDFLRASTLLLRVCVFLRRCKR